MVEFWGRSGKLFTLAQAVAEPNQARTHMDSIPKGQRVRVMVQNDVFWREKLGRPFLGKFDWAQVPTKGFPHYLSIFVALHGDPMDRKLIDAYPSEAFPVSVGTTPSGFAVYPHMGVISPNRMEPTTTTYVLSGRQRVRPSTHSYVVTCRWSGASTRSCTSETLSDDRLVKLRWEWWEEAFPEPEWRALDARLQDVADHLLVGRERSDIQ